MKIASIVGARPQFIKLAPLSKKIRKSFQEIIIHTGQHYDDAMSNAIFNDLQIAKPDYNLEIGSGGHGEQTGKMLIEIEKLLIKEKISLVIVFGDTNSTIAASLAATKLHIPVIHVEAGLRSFNRMMPEEINRIATDHISDYLFAPTQIAVEHLKNEGLEKKTWFTGDIMKDTLEESLPLAIQRSGILDQLNLNGSLYYLLTLHRPYNVDDPKNLAKILCNLEKLEEKVVFPIHPRTQKIIRENNISVGRNIITTGPKPYFDFLKLEYHAEKIITDSGGIQKEAYFLKKPCITFRTETEWIETVEDGWNILVDPTLDDAHLKVLNFSPKNEQSDVFGNNVSEKMMKAIESIIKLKNID
jgi:UDP-GlcNAc3NAcA epimerase